MEQPTDQQRIALVTGGANGIGITANAVAPGPVDTPMTRVLHSDEFRQTYTDAIPMKRYGSVDEIAATVSFLASDGAAYVTGSVIPVDGGFLAHTRLFVSQRLSISFRFPIKQVMDVFRGKIINA